MKLYLDAKTSKVLIVFKTEIHKGVVQYHHFNDDCTIGVKNQNEVLAVKYFRAEIYKHAWKYALQYCRMHGICTSTKKWEPWEKKFFFHIYDTVLERVK